MPSQTTETQEQATGTGPEPSKPLGILVDDLLREGVLQTSRDHEARTRGVASEEEPPDEEEEESEEEPEPEGEEPEVPAEAAEPFEETREPAPEPVAQTDLQADVDKFAVLLAKGGKRWSSIPLPLRGQAIDRAIELARASSQAEVQEAAAQALNIVRDQAYQRGWAEREASLAAEAEKAEIEAMSDEELGEFARANPQRYAAYVSGLQPQQPAPVVAAMDVIRNDPQVKAICQNLYNQDPHRYDDTETGRFNLVGDVRAAQQAIAAQRAEAERAPVRQQAEARQKAAKTRAKQTVDAGSGGSPTTRNGDSLQSLAGDGYKNLLRRGVAEANRTRTR